MVNLKEDKSLNDDQHSQQDQHQQGDQHLHPQANAGVARKRRMTNRRLSAVGGMWQKAASNVTSPLPVSLAKQNSFKHKRKDTLDVDPNDTNRKVKFNKNCKDQWGRSALFIAMIHQNLEMLELLLDNKVRNKRCSHISTFEANVRTPTLGNQIE